MNFNGIYVKCSFTKYIKIYKLKHARECCVSVRARARVCACVYVCVYVCELQFFLIIIADEDIEERKIITSSFANFKIEFSFGWILWNINKFMHIEYT